MSLGFDYAALDKLMQHRTVVWRHVLDGIRSRHSLSSGEQAILGWRNGLLSLAELRGRIDPDTFAQVTQAAGVDTLDDDEVA